MNFFFKFIYIYIYIDPYTPYKVSVSAVTEAGIGKSLYKTFFIKETGIDFKSKVY